MKFQILKTNRTEKISDLTTDRLILPEQVLEMRWISGDKWCQFYAPLKTNWQELCKRARSAKQSFKQHLGATTNG